MAIEEGGSNMYMPVAPAYGGGYGNGGFGGDWGWLILVLLVAGGGRFGLGGCGGGCGGGGGDYTFPWILNGQTNLSNSMASGFRDVSLNDGVNSIRDGVNGLSNQLCNGFAGTTAAITGAQNALAAQMYGDTIANLERSFATQTAITGGLNSLSSQFANCCCENRLGIANLNATIAREGCADREALNYATRDIITSQTAGIQRILDQLCSDKIDAKNEKIADLERQLTMANLAASQTAQTAKILADNSAQTVALERYLNPAPIPAYNVPNPNGCGCGCGCGSGFAN